MKLTNEQVQTAVRYCDNNTSALSNNNLTPIIKEAI